MRPLLLAGRDEPRAQVVPAAVPDSPADVRSPSARRSSLNLRPAVTIAGQVRAPVVPSPGSTARRTADIAVAVRDISRARAGPKHGAAPRAVEPTAPAGCPGPDDEAAAVALVPHGVTVCPSAAVQKARWRCLRGLRRLGYRLFRSGRTSSLDQRRASQGDRDRERPCNRQS